MLQNAVSNYWWTLDMLAEILIRILKIGRISLSSKLLMRVVRVFLEFQPCNRPAMHLVRTIGKPKGS